VSQIFYHGHEYHLVIKTADLILKNIDNENTDVLVVKCDSLVRLGHLKKQLKHMVRQSQSILIL